MHDQPKPTELHLELLNDSEVLALLAKCQAEMGRRAVADVGGVRSKDISRSQSAEAHSLASARKRKEDIDAARLSIASVLGVGETIGARALVDTVAEANGIDPDLVQDVFNGMIEGYEIIVVDETMRMRAIG